MVLNDVVTANCSQSMSDISEHPRQYQNFSHATSSHNSSGSSIRAVAENLVKSVLEAAVRRVCGEEGEKSAFLKIAGRRESKMDVTGGVEIAWNVPQTRERMDIWNEVCSSTGEGSEFDDSKSSREDDFLIDRDHQVSFGRNENGLMFNGIACDMEAERKSLARRMVLKCIRAACNEITSRELLGGSLESLVSCTKRMKIDSPPPPPSLFFDTACSSSSNSSKTEPTFPLHDRCLTPESIRREQVWKKRGMSESQEVNSLLDYNTSCHRFSTPCTKRESDRLCYGTGSAEGVIHVSRGGRGSIGSIVTCLNMMTIDGGFSEGEEEEEESEESERWIARIRKNVRFDVSSLPTYHQRKAVLRSPPLPPRSPSPLTISSDDHILDARAAANAGCIPEMDFYVIFHSSPLPSVCQKFLCSNMNEINILFHCWLFRDVPCDPSISVSDQLQMGVFAPQMVQPVHLELVDGGVPFYYMEQR